MAKKKPSSSSSSSSASISKATIHRVSNESLVLRIKSSAEGSRRSTRLLAQKEKSQDLSLGVKKGTQKKKKAKAKTKKKVVKVDAKMPKKPPTAFFYYLEDFRKEFQEQNPEVKTMQDVGKACGEKWKTMTYEEKVRYYDIATEKRAEFDKAMAAYMKRKESGEDDDDSEGGLESDE